MSKAVSKLALTASVSFAIAFIFSCSGDDGGGEEKYSYCIKDGFCHEGPYTLDGCNSFGGMPSNNCPNGGGGGSSSSGGGSPSSSSVGGQGGGSSSSGGGIDPSVYLTDRQVYIMEFKDYDDDDNDATKKFNDGGTVYLNSYGSYGEIEIGKIESGKLKLTLPNIKDEYPELLEKWKFCYDDPDLSSSSGDLEDVEHEEQKESCADPGYSISPANLTSYFLEKIKVDVPGKNYCDVSLDAVKSGKWSGEASAYLYYFSAPGSITGRITGFEGIGNFNLSFSEGWNFVYYVDVPSNNGYYMWNVTTSFPAGNTLEWGLDCW